MSVGIVIQLAVLVACAIILLRSVKRVPAGQVLIVERLGRYLLTAQPGTHLLVPVVDAVKTSVDMTEQVIPYRGCEVVTSDGHLVLVDSQLWATIVDPVRATYQVASVADDLELLVRRSLRAIIGELGVSDVQVSRATIGVQMRDVLADAAAAWGLRIDRVEVQSIERAPAASPR
jgi:regulator of protease activity HflC (stomatin/prohibitin superfamily)